LIREYVDALSEVKKMNYVKEISKKIPIIAETDILVVGSGPGGMAAAISAARMGIDTLLVERYGCLGGNLTVVGVESIAWYRHEKTIDVEGIGIEFEQKAKSMGATYPEPQSKSEAINSEMFKYIADILVKEAGVKVLLHSWVIDVIVDEDVIKGVIIHNKSGRQAILAKRVIDCSGDADLIYYADAPYVKTPKEDMLPVTVMFSVIGVDKQRFLEYVKENPTTYRDWGKNWDIQKGGKEDELFSPYLEKPFEQARNDGVIPKDLTSIGGTWSTISDYGEATYLNMVHMTHYDGTDVWDLTKAEMEGRYQAIQAIIAMNKYVPGFEKARLRNFGMTLGVRDTRKIIGKYNLTEKDVLNQGRFEDSVGIFPEFVDGYGVLVLPTTGRYFQIPYRILVPQKIENLLVAGRCVAGDRISHASVRNMMCCTVTGQAAGVAAAVSIMDKVNVGEVNIKKLQKALKSQGVRID
jgi:hypothetical protein